MEFSILNTGNQPFGKKDSNPCTIGINKLRPIKAPIHEIIKASPAIKVNRCFPVKPKVFNTAYSLVLSRAVIIMVLHKTNKIIHNNLLAIDPKTNIGDYIIEATSLDKNNKEFIDIVKHKKYPFYGFQGHPEINNEELIDPFLEVVKASFSERKSSASNSNKTYTNSKIYKNSKIKTLKLRVLNT